MVIPYDERLGVHQQAERFTDHDRWDFENTPPDKYPLLLHYPYFQLYRKQVVKQADLVLAMHLRGDAFTPEQKARNFAYYEALTVRDSSLSACTQSVIAAEVGQLELAHDYLAEAALMDLHDVQHNTRDGLHMASLAGAWTALVAGFGGMRDAGRHAGVQPAAAGRHLPADLPAPLPRPQALRRRLRQGGAVRAAGRRADAARSPRRAADAGGQAGGPRGAAGHGGSRAAPAARPGAGHPPDGLSPASGLARPFGIQVYQIFQANRRWHIQNAYPERCQLRSGAMMPQVCATGCIASRGVWP